ncbi:MAG: TetR/AcrR family transcriptional regulator [Anaerolineales bacterium]|nr:TetR/AcrR family transcriptional regulator [Anaerolineales bacterium]
MSHILKHAELLFSRNGYLATTLDDIAAAVGEPVNASKDDLLWASALRIAEAFQSALEIAVTTERPIDDRLRHAIMAHIHVIVNNRPAANVYMHEWRFLSPERQTEYRQRRDAYEAQFRALVHEGIYAGVFAPVDEKFVTMMLLSALNWVSQWYRADGPMNADEIAHTLADLTLNGLYRRV